MLPRERYTQTKLRLPAAEGKCTAARRPGWSAWCSNSARACGMCGQSESDEFCHQYARRRGQQGRARARTEPASSAYTGVMNDLTPVEFEKLKARMRPQDRHRLRPDGMMEPELPPLHLCGGLLAPYLTEEGSPDLQPPPTSSAPALLPPVGVWSGPAVARGARGSEAEGDT